jgi:hypothetical protein
VDREIPAGIPIMVMETDQGFTLREKRGTRLVVGSLTGLLIDGVTILMMGGGSILREDMVVMFVIDAEKKWKEWEKGRR